MQFNTLFEGTPSLCRLPFIYMDMHELRNKMDVQQGYWGPRCVACVAVAPIGKEWHEPIMTWCHGALALLERRTHEKIRKIFPPAATIVSECCPPFCCCCCLLAMWQSVLCVCTFANNDVGFVLHTSVLVLKKMAESILYLSVTPLLWVPMYLFFWLFLSQ
ncbi:hypothetical protein BCR43DRAFT_200602 [Syncephalastrum racemosum]|uniref:Uncharacterized protein n=1 Tax=Syncephalastrum racemosum TaxID=13706 RepID=A0A1X2HHX6_SYNRA|nr:hypothetical protein BCR43DRAFT_200602 [Syncephalastrum racemosum]